MINTVPCHPGKLPELLNYARKLKMAVFMWGEPGIGKSESVWQFAKAENMKLEDVRLTQMDAPDLQGLRWIDEATGTTKSFRPEFFPIINEPGILFLDELTAAEPRMQATAYQLILDRRIGPHILPEKWMVVGAGNAPEHGAISYKMGSALSDRFIHVQVVAAPDNWIEWAVANDTHPTVLAFIKIKPDYLTTVMGQDKGANLICPSPRSWTRVSKIMYSVNDPTSASILINGLVGEAAAVEFKHITEEIAELPSMQMLLSGDKNNIHSHAKAFPMKMPCLYGLAYSLTSYVTHPEQFSQAMLLFDALLNRKSDLPIAEVETLANEMLLGKAVKLGPEFLQAVVSSPGYKVYSPRAKEIAKL